MCLCLPYRQPPELRPGPSHPVLAKLLYSLPQEFVGLILFAGDAPRVIRDGPTVLWQDATACTRYVCRAKKITVRNALLVLGGE